MQSAETISTKRPSDETDAIVLELTVHNHPGVMSHICGLFSRRAFNLEAILCLPEPNRKTSRLWLLVKNDSRIEQVLKQTAKLQDVQNIRRHADDGVFARLQVTMNNRRNA